MDIYSKMSNIRILIIPLFNEKNGSDHAWFAIYYIMHRPNLTQLRS